MTDMANEICRSHAQAGFSTQLQHMSDCEVWQGFEHGRDLLCHATFAVYTGTSGSTHSQQGAGCRD